MVNVLSMFCGCGGLDLGFIGNFDYRKNHFTKTGFNIKFAIDFDPDAIRVYKANSKYLGMNHCVQDDVKNISEDQIPEFDLLLAGFPCQPFSNAGNREGIHDKNGRGTLFNECERFLTAFKNRPRKKAPIGFVFENVRGIMSSKMPDGTTIPEEIVKRMKKHGYRCTYKLIKASNYGVPQDRYRVIMIGLRDDLPTFNFDLFDKVVDQFDLPNPKNNKYDLCLGSVLCDISNDAQQSKEIWSFSKSGQSMIEKIGLCADGEEKLKYFRRKIPLNRISETITKGRSWKNIPVEEMPLRFQKIHFNPEKYRAPNFYRRFALGEVCGTITASAQPENCGITHPFENRRFSIREIARIQSFPDDFVFPYTSVQNAYKVIGNAVPPVLGWVIATAIKEHLTGEFM